MNIMRAVSNISKLGVMIIVNALVYWIMEIMEIAIRNRAFVEL